MGIITVLFLVNHSEPSQLKMEFKSYYSWSYSSHFAVVLALAGHFPLAGHFTAHKLLKISVCFSEPLVIFIAVVIVDLFKSQWNSVIVQEWFHE